MIRKFLFIALFSSAMAAFGMPGNESDIRIESLPGIVYDDHGIPTLDVLVDHVQNQSILTSISPPDSMRSLVLNAGHHPVRPLSIADIDFCYIAPFSRLPFLLWPVNNIKTEELTPDLDEMSVWLLKNKKMLGVQGFQLIFCECRDWLGNEVWSFELEREGIRLHGANIDVHWRDGKLEGLLCNLPGPVLSIKRVESSFINSDSHHIWYPVSRGVGWRHGTDVVLATVKSVEFGLNTHNIFTGLTGKHLLTSVTSNKLHNVRTSSHQWTEYDIPQGTFPDQIDNDSQGLIWFSQPLNDLITVFNPVSETFAHIVTGDDDPDGLMVDDNDIVWSGLYNNNKGLGRADAGTHIYLAIPPPYTNAQMAIPFSTSQGIVWVSDHAMNRMSEFDPSSQTWLGSYTMPTSSCWVVDTTEDPMTNYLYFTEYNVNQLGVKAPGGPIQDIGVSSGGPAFNGYSNGKIYYTLWSRSVLGAYDVSSGMNTEYNFPVTNESGGPMDITANGDVVVGSRNTGYVFIFRIATETWESYKIPTDYPGLKDGLLVDANNVIWVTEGNAGKIAKLELNPVIPTLSKYALFIIFIIIGVILWRGRRSYQKFGIAISGH